MQKKGQTMGWMRTSARISDASTGRAVEKVSPRCTRFKRAGRWQHHTDSLGLVLQFAAFSAGLFESFEAVYEFNCFLEDSSIWRNFEEILMRLGRENCILERLYFQLFCRPIFFAWKPGKFKVFFHFWDCYEVNFFHWRRSHV